MKVGVLAADEKMSILIVSYHKKQSGIFQNVGRVTERFFSTRRLLASHFFCYTQTENTQHTPWNAQLSLLRLPLYFFSAQCPRIGTARSGSTHDSDKQIATEDAAAFDVAACVGPAKSSSIFFHSPPLPCDSLTFRTHIKDRV